jgi:cell division protein ZapA (FtsZ GTPase activity inhibitor)
VNSSSHRQIYGEIIRSDYQPAARLEELAYVDACMRRSRSGKVVVTSKIAVLAALHIADELFRLREAPARRPDPADLEQRLPAPTRTLEGAQRRRPRAGRAHARPGPCLSPARAPMLKNKCTPAVL